MRALPTAEVVANLKVRERISLQVEDVKLAVAALDKNGIRAEALPSYGPEYIRQRLNISEPGQDEVQALFIPANEPEIALIATRGWVRGVCAGESIWLSDFQVPAWLNGNGSARPEKPEVDLRAACSTEFWAKLSTAATVVGKVTPQVRAPVADGLSAEFRVRMPDMLDAALLVRPLDELSNQALLDLCALLLRFCRTAMPPLASVIGGLEESLHKSDWIPRIDQAVAWLRAYGNDQVRGAGEAEIVEVEATMGRSIPPALRYFLAKAGSRLGGLLSGSELGLHDLVRGQETAKDLLAEHHSAVLSKDAMVFCTHQGYQFLCFPAPGASDDPWVARYVSQGCLEDLGLRFSEWLLKTCHEEFGDKTDRG